MPEKLIRTSYVDPTVDPPEPRQGDTGLQESRQDQEGYFGPLHRMHGSELHSWGVASGLKVTATIGQAGLQVLPGVALDARGRLIPLVVGGHAKLVQDSMVPVTAEGVALSTVGLSGKYFLTIGWEETFNLAGVGSGTFNTETTPLLQLRAVDTFPDDGEEIILAWVELDEDGTVMNTAADRRRATGISVGKIELLSLVDEVDADPGTLVSVYNEPAAVLRTSGGGAAHLQASYFGVARRDAAALLAVHTNSGLLNVNGRTVLTPADPSVPQNTLDVKGVALVRGSLGIGKETPPETTLDVNGDAVVRDRLCVGRTEALGRVHAIDTGGFGGEDSDGTALVSNVPLVAQSNGTAIGILNGNKRQVFAINIEGNAGTAGFRGTPTFYDKAWGEWKLAFAIRGGTLAVGHNNPSAGTRLDVFGSSKDRINLESAVNVIAEEAIGIKVINYSETGEFPSLVLIPSGDGGQQAALMWGNVDIRGTLTKSFLQFKIDHPLDPAGRYLSHGGVESNEMKNIYDGELVLDESGEAEISLPDWFEALNERFRYQLTPLGRPAPNLHVSRKLADNRFAIAGGEPGTEVCWQVTGVRHDPYALANPLVVESDKEGEEYGRYRHPEPHGATPDLAIGHSMRAVRAEHDDQV
nr:hypothetical protein KitaXyl93_54660 [Kitasatospora sp. Xyl93]